ncbi:MAG: outer membrane porin, OprD family, partial [Acinetobacter sp.]
MPKAQKLILAVLINAALISSTYASEQSEAKGFVEDANGDVLFRTGYLTRDKKNGVDDTSSYAQTAMVK